MVTNTRDPIQKSSTRHALAPARLGIVCTLLCSVLSSASLAEQPGRPAEVMGIPFTEDAFVKIAEQGNTRAVTLFLNSGMAPDARETRGDRRSALAAAARAQQGDVVTILLKEGADVTGGAGREALAYSAWARRIDILRLLIDRGVDVGGDSGGFALTLAATYGNIQMVEALLDAGVDLRNRHGREAIYQAVVYGRRAIVELLLDRSADPNALVYDRENTLTAALRTQPGSGMFELLMNKGGDPNARNKDGTTPLMQAADWTRREAIVLLLAKGADVDAKDGWGRTVLDHAFTDRKLWTMFREKMNAGVSHPDVEEAVRRAAVLGDVEFLTSLLDEGADPNARDKQGATPLRSAAIGDGDVRVVELLVARGADVNAVDLQGHTALWFAVRRGHLGMVRTLIEKGADETDESSKRSFVSSLENGWLDMVQALLQSGFNPDDSDPDSGEAFLIMALAKGDPKIVSVLLEASADPNVRDKYGRSALLQLVKRGNQKDTGLVEMLLRYGADAHARTSDGRTALMAAAKAGRARILEALIKAGGPVNARDNKGWTALMSAVEGARPKSVRVLLGHGAGPRLLDRRGLTAVDLAQRAAKSASAGTNERAVLKLLRAGRKNESMSAASSSTRR